jgi:hypothetical protein
MRTLILFTTLSILAACGKSTVSVPVQSVAVAPEAPQQIPPFQVPNWTPREVPMLPLINSEPQMMEAMATILEFEGDPRLQTPDDRAVMQLLHAYVERRRPLNVIIMDAKDQLGMRARTAYSCQSDLYALTSGLRSSMPMFSLVLYHEVQHAVTCDMNLTRLGIERSLADASMNTDPCVWEPPAYAASARLLTAMIGRGRPPTNFGAGDADDIGSLAVLYGAWKALSENQFCRWYRSKAPVPQPAKTP